MLWVTMGVVLWLLANLAAPYAALLLAERISPGRLPAELLARGEARAVEFYLANTTMSYGYSCWLPGRGTMVIFNREFFRRATPSLVRFVVAHELGHAVSHHHYWRWAAVVTGAVLLPWVRRVMLRHEAEADAYAERLTGFKREFFDQLK